MASRYWVGGTGTWSTGNTANWSATSGGASGASVPVAGDDVYFDGNSGVGTITLNYSPTIQSFDHTGYAGSFGSTGSITLICTGHLIQSALTTYVNNGSQSLRLSAGLSSRNLHLVTSRMMGSGTFTIDAGLVFGEFYIVYTTPLTGFYNTNLGGNITINGAWTLDFSAWTNIHRLRSNTFGTTRTITLGASSTVSLSDVYFEYIAVTGTGVPVSGTRLSDIGYNSGITFTSPVTYYWIGNSGNYNDTTKYSLTSGGSPAGVKPLAHDKVIYDDNSFSANGQAISLNVNYIADLDFTALGGSKIPTLTLNAVSGQPNFFCGSLKLKSGMATTGSSTVWTMVGGRNSTFTQNGANLASVSRLECRNIGFILTLGSDLNMAAGLGFGGTSDGGFDSNNYNITVSGVSFSASTTRTITLGTSTLTLTGTGTIFNIGTTAGLTYSGASATIIFTDTSASSKTFSTGTGAAIHGNFIALPGGAGAIVFNSNNKTFNSINITGAKTVTFAASTVYTVASPNFSGSAGNIVTLQSSSAGTPFTLSTPSGYVRATYASIKDSTATGGAYFEAVNSTDVSGNTGWNFTTASAGGGLRAGKKFAAFGGARPINKVLDTKLHGYRKLGG